MSDPESTSTGGRLVAADGRALPLVETRLRAQAHAGRARVTVEQRFINTYADALNVSYQLPLPADGAVAGFEFTLAGERSVGRIAKRADAREQFEEAIAEGRSAALLEQQRSSVFAQEIGNIPAGQELIVRVQVDQPLAWLTTGEWEWRFPCVVAPRYLGGHVPATEAFVTDVMADGGANQPRLQLALEIRDLLIAGREPESTSHPIAARAIEGSWRVAFGRDESARLDRDLAVRWAVAGNEPGVTLDASVVELAEAGAAIGRRAFGVVALTPPRLLPGPAASTSHPVPRDLIVLMDTSGSMGGRPLEQAQRVVCALIRTLTPRDSLELISFGSRATHFAAQAQPVTESVRTRALAWVQALRASGGTEMLEGITRALAGVHADSQRQVLLITDGLIGFEDRVIAEILYRLPANSRVHTLGVGSAVNRSLTGPAARAGRGSEHVIGLDDEIEPAVERVLAKLDAPWLVNLRISGPALVRVGRERLPDVHRGSPVLIPIELSCSGGRLMLEADTAAGKWQAELAVPELSPGEGAGRTALAALFAREQVEDLEVHRAAAEPGASIDEKIESLGLTFGIATRLTSWIAVSERQTVDPSRPTRQRVQPQALPYGLSAEGLGLRPPSPLAAPGAAMLRSRAAVSQRALFAAPAPSAPARMSPPTPAAPPPPAAPAATPPAGAPIPTPKRAGFVGRVFDWFKGSPAVGDATEAEAAGSTVVLQGKVTLKKPGILVVTADAPADFDWERPPTVELQLADGSRVVLQVDPRSTASGAVQAGQSLRLWLTLSASLTEELHSLTAGNCVIHLSN